MQEYLSAVEVLDMLSRSMPFPEWLDNSGSEYSCACLDFLFDICSEVYAQGQLDAWIKDFNAGSRVLELIAKFNRTQLLEDLSRRRNALLEAAILQPGIEAPS